MFDYTYDVTDVLLAKTERDSDPLNSADFEYDSLGQMLTNQPSDPAAQATLVATTYAYDPAGHLTSIDTGSEATLVHFGIDALGRHAGQSIGPVGDETAVTTYAYLGTSDAVSSSRTVDGSGTSLTYSATDAIGNRLTSGTAAAFAYLAPDLHGNVVATMTSGSTPAFSAAYRYDAYGVTCDSYAPSGSIASPWRYQGRILESADGTADLYDFSARSYDPGLGAFTGFDSVSGSAQNPLTLNRYLYALANPATMIDPDGHAFMALVAAYAVCTECQALTVAGAIWVVSQVATHSEEFQDAGRAVVGVGDWGLQKTTQAWEWASDAGTGHLAERLAQSRYIRGQERPYVPANPPQPKGNPDEPKLDPHKPPVPPNPVPEPNPVSNIHNRALETIIGRVIAGAGVLWSMFENVLIASYGNRPSATPSPTTSPMPQASPSPAKPKKPLPWATPTGRPSPICTPRPEWLR